MTAVRTRYQTTTGIGAVALIAIIATFIGPMIPVLGPAVVGLVIGVVLSPLSRQLPKLAPGVKVAGSRVLQIGVVLLGTQLSVAEVVHVGARSLPVMLGTLTVCLALSGWLGRWLRVHHDARTLIGVGTGICGASAIAAVSR